MRRIANGWHERDEERLREPPSKDEIRQRFVAALSSCPDSPFAIADLCKARVAELVGIEPPMRMRNLAPYGWGRLPGLRKRTIRRQKAEKVDMWASNEPIAIIYAFDAAGNAIYETVTVELPSATVHILDETGAAICSVSAELERVPDECKCHTEVCRACHLAREKLPWPDWIYPGEDRYGPGPAPLISFEEARARRRQA